METVYNYKSATLAASFKDADLKKGIVTGYFSAFGNKDSDGDIIVRGAFNKSISLNGPHSPQPRIKHLLNHKPDQPLGKLTELREDSHGLYYESKIGSHSIGQEFLKMVEDGLISEHSIGFRTIRKEDSKDGNLLKEIQLWEGSSLTSWGANANTPITGLKTGIKAPEVAELVKQQRELEEYCNRHGLNEETYTSLLLYHKQLLQFYIDHSEESTAQAKATPQQVYEMTEADLEQLEAIYKLIGEPTYKINLHRLQIALS